MSLSAVLDYVQGRVQTINNPTGAAAAKLACIEGIPHEGMPSDIPQYPLCVLSIQNMEPEHATFGVAGNVFEHYAVIITVFLGPDDMAHDQAVAWGKMFPQRFRAVFTPDWKLGGNCFDSNLRGPADNLAMLPTGQAMYQAAGQKPRLEWALMVDEQAAANAAAS